MITPRCLGQIRQNFNRADKMGICSKSCPMTHLCTMLVIRDYARQLKQQREQKEDNLRELQDNG